MQAEPGRQLFGTFKGVFTPSILTILGVIMYLRLGWVVGNVGLPTTLVIITVATAVTFLTGLSIAATATNMRVGIGGAYYMISRSLGLEAGAAIGVPLFLAQALGISFYVVGFAESVNRLAPVLPITAIGAVTLVVLGAVAYRSADLALKAQFFIMGAIAVSLVSLFAGGPPAEGFGAVGAVPPRAPFWEVFAVFFPAVTGIEAGIALSGNLRDPGRSLPLGTLSAVVVGWLTYLAIAVALAVWVPPDVLITDPLVMRKVAFWSDAILLGVWGATLSSALGSLLGAPRTLQALAKDGVVPAILGRGDGPTDEPRIATAVSFAIGMAGVLAGSLNAIAPVLSMFFLTSYGFLNVSAGLEGVIGSPSWRPQFRTPWWASLAGAALCLSIMLMIDAGATMFAGVVCVGIYLVMQRRNMRAYWGDMRHGILMLLARYAVYRLAEVPPDPRTWRPNILVLSGDPERRWYLVELADALTHGTSFLTVASVIPEGPDAIGRVADISRRMAATLRERRVPGLVDVVVADDLYAGASALIQASGVGPLFPNTIVLGETRRPARMRDFARLIRTAQALRRNLVIVRQVGGQTWRGRRIDVWWGGEAQNAGLMLALAWLLQDAPTWQGATLVVKTVVAAEAQREEAEARLRTLIASGRLNAELAVLVLGDRSGVFDVIREASMDADFVFLGIRAPGSGESVDDYAAYYGGLLAATRALPPTALVIAAEDIDFQRIFE